ncbi:MAG: pro-sigmaK processing inhibitor BofA family protein [Ruminococcus sp.]|nr:pro-sigmaK processing inhibitor BofA family protein [Ruminococcus sp.]
MKLWQYSLVIICTFLFYALIYKLCKKKKPFKRAFFTMLFGIVLLIAVDVASIYTGVYLPVSALSVTASACGGAPAVAAMLIITRLM